MNKVCAVGSYIVNQIRPMGLQCNKIQHFYVSNTCTLTYLNHVIPGFLVKECAEHPF